MLSITHIEAHARNIFGQANDDTFLYSQSQMHDPRTVSCPSMDDASYNEETMTSLNVALKLSE